MKLNIEIDPSLKEDEIIIRASKRDDRISRIEDALEKMITLDSEIILTLDDTEYYLPKNDILFFETAGNKVAAHTVDSMYYTSRKLYELETVLPSTFLRISKSCIINTARIKSLAKNLTGASRVTFEGCEKTVYVSRSYYKLLKDKIYNMRFSKE